MNSFKVQTDEAERWRQSAAGLKPYKPRRRRIIITTMSSAESASLGRALCIITGASRGFGRAVSRELSRLVTPGSGLVLAARSGEDLHDVQAELAASEAGRAGLRVESVVADVGRTEGLEAIIRAAKDALIEQMDHVMLVNNAGEDGLRGVTCV